MKGACCWKKNDPYTCPHAPQCDAYMTPCGENLVQALFAMENQGSSTSSGSSSSIPNSIPDAPSDMTLRCSLAHINQSPNGLSHCEESCHQAKCCYDPNVVSCQGKFPNQCNPYQACTVLIGSDGSPGTGAPSGGSAPEPPPDNLSDICDAVNMLDMSFLQVRRTTMCQTVNLALLAGLYLSVFLNVCVCLSVSSCVKALVRKVAAVGWIPLIPIVAVLLPIVQPIKRIVLI